VAAGWNSSPRSRRGTRIACARSRAMSARSNNARAGGQRGKCRDRGGARGTRLATLRPRWRPHNFENQNPRWRSCSRSTRARATYIERISPRAENPHQRLRDSPRVRISEGDAYNREMGEIRPRGRDSPEEPRLIQARHKSSTETGSSSDRVIVTSISKRNRPAILGIGVPGYTTSGGGALAEVSFPSATYWGGGPVRERTSVTYGPVRARSRCRSSSLIARLSRRPRHDLFQRQQLPTAIFSYGTKDARPFSPRLGFACARLRCSCATRSTSRKVTMRPAGEL